MWYIIRRYDENEPFDRSEFEIHVEGKVYDVIKQDYKNTPLHNLAEYVIDDNLAIVKSSMMNESDIKAAFEAKVGKKVNELLYG
jgi:hypothetical protein